MTHDTQNSVRRCAPAPAALDLGGRLRFADAFSPFARRPSAASALARIGLTACLVLGTVAAHGGQYRGPGARPAIARATGPTSPGARGPTTPGRSPGATPQFNAGPDPTRWQVWWEFHREEFLSTARRRAIAGKLPPEVLVRPGVGPTDIDRRDLILPALAQALGKTSNRDISSSCMLASAKLGVDHSKFPVLDLFRERLPRGNQEVRETATLSLGLSRKRDAIPLLISLLTNGPEARRRLERVSIGDRTRAFAAWGLALIGERDPSLETDRQLFDLFQARLEDKEERSRDVRVAAIHGLRMLNVDPERGGRNKLLYWQLVALLEKYWQRKDSVGDQIVQAHVAPALARVLGPGKSSDHQRIKAQFAEILVGRRKVSTRMQQSAAMALGAICIPGEEDAAFRKALMKFVKTGKDQQAKHYALIALGRSGGDTEAGFLLTTFHRKSSGNEKDWSALALGLMARRRFEAKPQDPLGRSVCDHLRRDLHKTRNRNTIGAIAISVALARDPEAKTELRKLAKQYRKHANPGGYACIALALLGDTAAAPLIESILLDAKRRPVLIGHAALALSALDYHKVAPTLHRMLDQPKVDLLVGASVSYALGFLGDRRSIKPLITLLQNEKKPTLARAFAAVALGMIGEPGDLPWHTTVANGVNYSALVGTLSNGLNGLLDLL